MVKVKDYSHRHKVFVVRTEVNTQYTERSGWKWRTTHADTKCLLSGQKSSTLSISNNQGESEGLLTQTQSVCCQDRSQHSVYRTIRVKVKDYSHTKCLLSEQKSTLSILNNQGESEGLLTQTQSVCCQDRSHQHSVYRTIRVKVKDYSHTKCCRNRSQHSVYWTIRVKVKDYSRGHKVGVVWTEVNTQDPGAVTWQCSSQVGVLSEKERKTHLPLNFWQQSGQVEMSMLASGTNTNTNPILAVGR